MKKRTCSAILSIAAMIAVTSLSGCGMVQKTDQKTEETTAPKEETSAAKEESAVTESAGTESAVIGSAATDSTEAESVTVSGEAALSDQTSGDTTADAVQKGSGQVIVYNWGEYIDPDILTQFTEETGIKVVYEEFETNEVMYPKVAQGASAYDLICPSDYMIAKMIANDLLQPIDFDQIPNYKNIDPEYIEKSKGFDPENKYSIPYCWGTVGILYNTTMVDEPVDSWKILWDEKYRDSILMQDSYRDAYMIPEKLLGYDINTVDKDELERCTDMLLEQKPLVQAYVIDQVRDKMIGEEAALGVIYSGEAIYTKRENENLEYVIPKEGSNVWIDSWVMPKNAPDKENAEIFLNFLCRADIALKNFEYITYSTPNKAARDLIEDEDIRNSTVAFPTEDMLKNCDTYSYIGEEGDELYSSEWNRVKAG